MMVYKKWMKMIVIVAAFAFILTACGVSAEEQND